MILLLTKEHLFLKKSNKSPSPLKNYQNISSFSDQKCKSSSKNIIPSPSINDDKKENNENIESENTWKAPEKIQVDVDDLLQRAMPYPAKCRSMVLCSIRSKSD